MRKIIANKSYDTNTASLVGAWDNREYGNLDYVSESLYRKRTGEYFIHGAGGRVAATRNRTAITAGVLGKLSHH